MRNFRDYNLNQTRTYRNWVEGRDLVSFPVKINESDLFIRAKKDLKIQAQKCLAFQRRLIQDYIQKDTQFAKSLKPYSPEEEAPDIVRAMAQAASAAGVGPMAAVAGAIAEYVGKELLQYSQEVVVENGGDIFMKTDKVRKVGIFAGKSSYTGKLALEISHTQDYWGICTSSATVGPSLSFGQTDAAVAICNSAILADAWATRLGNMIKSAGDIEKTLKFVQDKPNIKGVVIILGEKVGAYGEVELVRI